MALANTDTQDHAAQRAARHAQAREIARADWSREPPLRVRKRALGYYLLELTRRREIP